MEESENKTIVFPLKKSWYWILIIGYTNPTPCWFGYEATDQEEYKCFLPGGMGDSSSTGIYIQDIEKIGPEIVEPNL